MRQTILLVLILTLSSCANPIKKAARNMKYSAWEKMGVEKRDLFKREVTNVKEEQTDSGEAFKDALTQLKEVYGFNGGNLENEYNKLNSSYKIAQEQSEEARASIEKLNTLSGDLFTEWKEEIKEIESKDLKKQSTEKLAKTKAKYNDLYEHLKTTEKKMGPVLTKFKDQVLFLKHNLNAEAIGGLKTEGKRIQSDIESLIQEMNQSTAEAEKFIQTL